MLTNLDDCPPEKVEDLLKETLERICEQPHGIVFLQILHKMCGFAASSIVLDDSGRIEPQATFNCEARRALYLQLRKFIPREQLVLIELPDLADPKQKVNRTNGENEDVRDEYTGNDTERRILRTAKRRASARD